jgi:hypothetical protein
MPDLLGYTDVTYPHEEIDVLSAEHIRQTIVRAVSTLRGSDWENPGSWQDLVDLIETRDVASALQARLQHVATDLIELDPRIDDVRFAVGERDGVIRWTAEAHTSAGVVLVESALAVLPQDEPDLAYVVPPVLPGKSIRRMLVDRPVLPRYLQRGEGGRLTFALGLAFDAQLEWHTRAIQQRFASVCEPAALLWIGRDRKIFRGRYEPEAAIRSRLQQWLPAHRNRGMPWTILRMVQSYFLEVDGGPLPTVHLVENNPQGSHVTSIAVWSTLSADREFSFHREEPTNWNWDSEDPDRPAGLEARDPRLAIIIEAPPFFAPRTSAQAAAADPEGMNGLIRVGDARVPAGLETDIVDLVSFWKQAGAWIGWVLVHLGPVSPSGSGEDYPDGRWFDPLNDARDGNRIPQTWRVLYQNRYHGDWLAAAPAPYP